MMWPSCHANLKRLTTTNGAPTPRGTTIVINWATLQGRMMILHFLKELEHLTLPLQDGLLIRGPHNT